MTSSVKTEYTYIITFYFKSPWGVHLGCGRLKLNFFLSLNVFEATAGILQKLSSEEKYKIMVTESRISQHVNTWNSSFCSCTCSINRKIKIDLFGKREFRSHQAKKEPSQVFCIYRVFSNHCITE